jgi:hypothetical protein
LAKNVLGYFFTNSSGHPAQDLTRKYLFQRQKGLPS